MNNAGGDRIYSIQFLRGVAAFLVVTTHALNEFGIKVAGAVGVDLFFAISGFVMYYVTADGVRNFLVRRAIRILPLYYLVTTGLFLLVWLSPDLLRTAQFDVLHYVASLLFLPYYSEASGFQPLLTLGWTLNFEMFFYAVVNVATRINLRWRMELTSFSLLLVMTFATLLVRHGVIPDTHPLAFYSNNIIIEFIFGMVLARVCLHSGLARLQEGGTGRTVALLIACAGFYPLVDTFDEGTRGLVWGVPSALLLLLFVLNERLFAGWPLMRRISGFLGDISYASYLIHMYLIAAIGRLLHLRLGLTYMLLVYILVPVLSYGIFRYFEAPLSRYLRNRLSRGRARAPDARVPAKG